MLITEVREKPKPIKVIKEKKRRKRSARQLLEAKLDAICREIVLDRDHRCVCPAPSKGHSQVLQCGHLITRSKESVRWDLYNLSCQCSSCNLLHEYFPYRYIAWFMTTFGGEKFYRLTEDAEKVSKLQLYELQELLDQLKKIRQKQLQSILTGEPFKPYYTQSEILSGAWAK